MPETREAFAESIEAYRNLDASGVHLWVEGVPATKSVANGTLTTTGRFEQVRGPSHEADDRVVIHPDNRRMTFEMFLDSEGGTADRGGIVFDVFPTDAAIALEQLTVDGEAVPVLMGRDTRWAGELPVEIVRESPDIAIDHPDELFQNSVPSASGTATGASAHIGFVSRAQGKLSDLEPPIVERLKALGYVE